MMIIMTGQSFGQVSGGILGSYNISTAQSSSIKVGNEAGYVTHTVDFVSIEDSYSYGVFSQYNTGHMMARVEGMMTNMKTIYDVNDNSIIRSLKNKHVEKSSYIDINILAGLDYEGFNISSGPAIHFLTDHSNELSENDFYSQNPANVSYGYIGSLGYDLGRFHLDLRYERNFRAVDNNSRYSSRKTSFNQNPNMIKFTLGMRLF